MYDLELVQEILKQILTATEKVIYRFKPVNNVAFFTDSHEGMEKLDSICMLLIAIGEGFKNIDKITNGSLLSTYPEINWKGVKSMRDIISHQYFSIDAEIIFNVCDKNIKDLHNTILKILHDLKNQQ
ncbi:MAG: DUF86 domain-containing protein [Desulfobacula sp.]|jgi:uncharacterized protein with HEPN domain|nr:DUF86 domain-containing protein [Desulfobacula sp.]